MVLIKSQTAAAFIPQIMVSGTIELLSYDFENSISGWERISRCCTFFFSSSSSFLVEECESHASLSFSLSFGFSQTSRALFKHCTANC
jgi:hypothetical protein